MKKNNIVPILVCCLIAFVFLTLCLGSDSTDEPQIDNSSYKSSVIFETDLLRITATNINTSEKETEIKLLIENFSPSNAVVSCSSYIVNGMMIDTVMYAEVTAKANANCSIYLDGADLRKSGIEKISQIIPYDSHVSFDSGKKYPLDYCITINEDHTQTVNEEGKLLYSANGITVISKFEPGSASKKIPMLIKNESGMDLHIGTSYVTVNGFTVPEISYYTPICNGTYRYFEIELSPFEKENQDIGNFETASFCLSFMKPKSTQIIFQTEQLHA